MLIDLQGRQAGLAFADRAPAAPRVKISAKAPGAFEGAEPRNSFGQGGAPLNDVHIQAAGSPATRRPTNWASPVAPASAAEEWVWRLPRHVAGLVRENRLWVALGLGIAVLLLWTASIVVTQRRT
jgi:hypothetical protein